MNAERRKRLEKVLDDLEGMQEEIDSICKEETEAYENMPESLQGSERGETMSNNVDLLDDIKDEMENISENIQEIFSN